MVTSAYRDGVAVVMEAISNAVRRDTPVRLKLLTVLAAGAAAALLLAAGPVMATIQDQVRVIGHEAAPQAATTADLYFALSDLDAQTTRILLTAESDALAGSRLDALAAYRERGRQVDAGLQRCMEASSSGSFTDTERRLVLDLLDGLAVYRQRVGQALAAQPHSAGEALGYYTQATTVLHLRLLPDARRLRLTAEDRLDRAYAAKSSTEATASGVVVLLGGALLVLLVTLQVWLARRFRRLWNPALIAATALTLLLLAGVTVVLGAQQSRLTEARAGGLRPYLELSELRAIGYDAAADTSRYLVSGNLGAYRDDFTWKAKLLAALDGDAGQRWVAYQRGHERILALADHGKRDQAVTALTGIRRGDAAFDFAYFDAALAAATDASKAEFDRGLADAERTLTGAVTVPVTLLVLVILLIPIGVRRRLAEYR
ncbi:hypothetical protein AMIS_55740 [Actinoplanes missouriensis 431]|uniref:Secreted protein n=1 Tax=Actinoplanes missouriensis (strain ATCC 14538 / DSM 43046 / CBS 188.64 / JCM 3121 / NBRC 102363 / NCIMB 12654 / NRRL B-3342 / UNCC 431) TaxID=512565 RepID=I0HCQ7_ACTM4|nr:hypothetical protein [Actinoplanes missouriensis]BAL90794.1 hypothetical protein AMIS_55740 [Actinoplanes missouriensis 431]